MRPTGIVPAVVGRRQDLASTTDPAGGQYELRSGLADDEEALLNHDVRIHWVGGVPDETRVGLARNVLTHIPWGSSWPLG